MPASLGVPVHVIHVAGEAAVEPIAQAVEAVGRPRRGDADKIKAENAGLQISSEVQAIHPCPHSNHEWRE